MLSHSAVGASLSNSLKKAFMKTVADRAKENVNTRAHKGGRPKKRQHLDQKLTVMCSRFDVITIRHYAKGLNMSVSEYLRLLGLKRQVDRKAKSLPKEVLQMIGTLNHLAANLN